MIKIENFVPQCLTGNLEMFGSFYTGIGIWEFLHWYTFHTGIFLGIYIYIYIYI